MVPPKILAVMSAAILLSGCATHVADVPAPQPREEPINSLALEQCVGENGQERCLDGTP